MNRVKDIMELANRQLLKLSSEWDGGLQIADLEQEVDSILLSWISMKQ